MVRWAAWGWRRKVVAGMAAAGMVLGTGAPAEAAEAGPPVLQYGFGLSAAGAATGSATDFVLTVNTAEVAGAHHVKVILPADYWERPEKRYPVLYFLHGASDDPVNQTYAALRSASMITVVPDGGLRGWYSNWRNQNTAAGAQNWENFHIKQVIPFIDANLRTIAAKRARAVAGISMGGFGALHYAQLYPGLFSQVGTMSGDNDLSAASMDLRLAAVASLTNGVGLFCTSGNCSFGPTVSSDALFGSPYPVFNADRLWNEANPTAHVDRLAGMGISIYVGNGGGNPVELEFWLEGAAEHLANALDAQGLPYYYKNYGNGAAWGGPNCQGKHNGFCWAQNLTDYIPRIEQALATA